MPGAEPNLSFIQGVLEAKAVRVQPPDYWLTVRSTGRPWFGGNEKEQLVALGESPGFWFWTRSIPPVAKTQSNNQELRLVARVTTALVLKGTNDLQRQMALGVADLFQFFINDPEQTHPEYTGANTWGLLTRQTPGVEITWEYPKIAGVNGIGILWGSWDIEFRHPLPKG